MGAAAECGQGFCQKGYHCFAAPALVQKMQHSTAQHSTAQHSTAQHSTAQHSTAQHSTAQHSTVLNSNSKMATDLTIALRMPFGQSCY